MNPITEARIDAGISKNSFSHKINLSRTWILRAEEGCYSNPGPKLIEFTMKQLGITRNEFKRRYAYFQQEVRKTTAQTLDPIQVMNRVEAEQLKRSLPGQRLAFAETLEFTFKRGPKTGPVGSFPVNNSVDDLVINNPNIVKRYMHEVFKEWRETYFNSTISFARSMCVHPESVNTYEKGLYDAMPYLIEDALKEVKLMDDSFDPRTKWVYVHA